MTTTLSHDDIMRLSERVETAQTYGCAIRRLTEDYPDMTITDGYQVQHALRRNMIKKGHRQIGWKTGLTSKAKMRQMGVDVPSIGFLTDRMVVPESSEVSVKGLIHPRVECEIAFVMKAGLKGPNCTREDVMAATDFVLPTLEIIDSRFTGFKFDLESVIADNGSAAKLAAGGRSRYVEGLDLPTIGVMMEKNGEVVAMAAAAEVMGHPADAVAMVANILAEYDEEVKPGDYILSGAITAAIPAQPGDFFTARFYELGDVSIRFTE